MGESGKIYQGCNVENASFGLTICAERNAVFQAIAQGENRFSTIYIATKDGGLSFKTLHASDKRLSFRRELIVRRERIFLSKTT